MDILAQMRKARECQVALGDRSVTITRPTVLDMEEWPQGDGARSQLDYALTFVRGWNFRQCDLLENGVGDPVDYDAEALRVWLSDEPDHAVTLITAVVDAYKAHRERQEDNAKN